MTAASVAVNLLWCVPGKVGGSEEYLVRQLLGLAEIGDDRWSPEIYAPKGFATAHPDLAALIPVHAASFDSVSRLRRIAGEAGWFHRRTGGAALRHHGGGTAPARAQRPYVLTVHDLQYRTFPENFSLRKRAYFAAVLPRSIGRAAVVTVPTEYVRGTVIDAFTIDPSRVRVVPHGVEPALLADVTPEAELRERYALGGGPVIVYPAITYPHKNHRFLLDMMAHHWRDPDLRLVLTGAVGSSEPDVAASTDRRICRLGRVPAADRNGLVAMASAMVFPSRYEGFGAPLIEAMALGTPVISSDATCLPEVARDAALVLPLEQGAWATALHDVNVRRDELIAAGHRRVQAFTARASGEALAGAYVRAMEVS